jgi:phage-related protein
MCCSYVPDLGHYAPSKPVIFHPAARAEIQDAPKSVRWAFGKALWALQLGRSLSMPHSRPMPIVALGVEELRVKDESGQYRAFVIRKTPRGIFVLHVFAKKSRETPHAAIVLARNRLKEM